VKAAKHRIILQQNINQVALFVTFS